MLPTFDTSIQCEEYFSGYSEWSEELESDLIAAAMQSEDDVRIERENTRETEAGAILIKRECTHRECGFHCQKAFRIGGFDL